jgi:hypothetical protein
MSESKMTHWHTGFLWSLSVVSLVGMTHSLWVYGRGVDAMIGLLGFVLTSTLAWARTFQN